MKFVRFLSEGTPVYGLVEGEIVKKIEGSPFDEYRVTKIEYGLSSLKVLPPCEPSKIVGIALNYRDHAEEIGKGLPEEPEFFIKPSTAVIGHEDKIIYPKLTQKLGFEAELAVVIKKKAKDLSEEEALDYVLGYTCFNDVSARDIQNREKHRTRAKSFDTFAPTGPFLVTDIDPSNLAIKSYLNGSIRQSSTTEQLIFSVKKLVSFVSQSLTLLPGDLIATGTPEKTGLMVPGDTIEVEIEKVGRLKNPIVSK
jgi:2-keto-4-pentenoate hydratase/2-oxohepta-3-ene-1,7-dioic acid hydratase in catechol pathway